MNRNSNEPFDAAPETVRVLRTLGKGRAATARLVEATFENGKTIRCVEKVFAPGRLTRAIYRICFWAPFAYQFNRNAIAACFYRRRVASEILRRSEVDVGVAKPLYVRFDPNAPGWVLAAEHIQGRGIRPSAKQNGVSEIKQIIACMEHSRDEMIQAGLTGSGWQVDPKAMVSTANLLRCGDRYTIVDLESGIPAVLVPRYLAMGIGEGTLPPFDDLSVTQLERIRTAESGDSSDSEFLANVDALIHHTCRWKESEPAPLRLSTWSRLTARLVKRVRNTTKLTWRMLASRRFQTLVGKRSIRKSISNWRNEQRISAEDATHLYGEIDGVEVATYARGLALHLAIKSTSPLVVPAKLGGVVAAATTGNLWFLLPWLVLPIARTTATILNWVYSQESVPHRHALMIGSLPTVGTLAFPVQLYVRRPMLSRFLIRDAASRIGRTLPIYGGKDSRTEIAMIESCDWLLKKLHPLATVPGVDREEIAKSGVTLLAFDDPSKGSLPSANAKSGDSKAA